MPDHRRFVAQKVEAHPLPRLSVVTDSSYDGPYGAPMDPGAQARFDACWPRAEADLYTALALARHLALYKPPSDAPVRPKSCVCVWVWNTEGPILVRHNATFTDGGFQTVATGRMARQLVWLPSHNGWASSIEGRKTLETVHTQLDCTVWSQHTTVAFMAWSHGLIQGATGNAA